MRKNVNTSLPILTPLSPRKQMKQRPAMKKRKHKEQRQHKNHAAAALQNSRCEPSLRSHPRPSECQDERAARIATLETFDAFAGLRNGLRKVAEMKGEWAGIPMPLEGERLIIEPKFNKGRELADIGAPAKVEDTNGEVIRNQFWSTSRRQTILIWQEKDGRLDWGPIGRGHHFDYDLKTLMCSQAWGLEQEQAALQTMAGLVRHHQMKQYVLTGMFMEQSKRSKVFYLFRRLKPTIAMRADAYSMRILCAMCLHPIAYYEGTWAGAMCPTDDVLAHLMLMRGDEHHFWKSANQHPAWRPEAGL